MIAWEDLELNDGHWMPALSFSTDGLLGGPDTIDQVDQALSVGYGHIDTAPSCGNEIAVGIALRESGLSRGDVYITTKYIRSNGLGIEASMRNSLNDLSIKYVDMYVLDRASYDQLEILSLWKQMETLRERGLARSIGVRNFTMLDLHLLLRHARIKPAVNQIPLNPYNLSQQSLLIEYAAKHDILIQAYNLLTPTTRYPGGPLDRPLKRIAHERSVATEYVLMAWARAKGAGIVLTLSAKQRQSQVHCSTCDIDLSYEDVASLDLAGSYGPGIYMIRTLAKRVVAVAATSMSAFWICNAFDRDPPSSPHYGLGKEHSRCVTP